MANRVFSPAALDDAEWAALADTVQRFEQTWRSQAQPALADFVPGSDDLRRTLLLTELIKVDQELRWESHAEKNTEEYLEDWPELQGNDAVIVELLRAECLTRATLGDLPSIHELERRFPKLCDHVDLDSILEEAKNDRSSAHGLIPSARLSDGPVTRSSQDRFGRYLIRGSLGAGAMGTVYRAYDSKLEREVALKLPQFDDPQVLTQFISEAKAAARIRHANICPIFDVDEVDGIHFITMALIEGQSLAERMRSHQFKPLEAATLVQKLATALGEVHARGVVHRDVKPSNVMLDSQGEPLLMDFGLARHSPTGPECTRDSRDSVEVPGCGGELNGNGSLTGTPIYMSPEQAKGQPADARSDIYSLGILLYQLLSGKPPFTGPLDQLLVDIANVQPQPPRQIRPEVPEQLEAICLKAICKSPEDRYQSGNEMAKSLDTYIAEHRHRLSLFGRRQLGWVLAGSLLCLTVIIIFKTPDGPKRIEAPDNSIIEFKGDSIVITPNSVTKPPPIEKPKGDGDVLLLSQADRWIAIPGGAIEGICPHPDGSTVFVPSTPQHSVPVQLIDLATGQVQRKINFGAPPDALANQQHMHKGLAVSRNGRYLYLTNYYSSHVTRVDLQEENAVPHLRVGGQRKSVYPSALAITPNGERLIVCLGQENSTIDDNDYVSIVDIRDGRFALLGEVKLADEIVAPNVGFSADSQFTYFVTQKRKSDSPTLCEVALTPPYRVIKTLNFPESEKALQGVAVSSKHNRVFVSGKDRKKVWMVSRDTFELQGEIDFLGHTPDQLAMNGDESLLVVLCRLTGSLFCIDPKSGEKIGGASGFEDVADDVKFTGNDRVLVSRASDPMRIAVFKTSDLLDRVVFASNREGRGYQLYLMALDGGKLLRLTEGPFTNRSPRWSPDGSKIAFMSNREGPMHVCVMNRDGTALRAFNNTNPILGVEGDASLDWSPEGDQIAFIGDEHRAIRVVNVETEEVETLLSKPIGNGQYAHHNGLSWDRANNRILFNSQHPRNAKMQNIFALDPKSHQVTQLTHDSDGISYFLTPAASPDGTKIVAPRYTRDAAIPRNIFSLSRTGKDEKQLTHHDDRLYSNPCWFRDSRRIIGSAGAERSQNIWLIQSGDGNAIPLTRGEWNDAEPDITGAP